ncbi:FlgO family outer membrane protein [Pseudoalteromonas carrageenovora]|uniref:FlgO family outer membrane protein n=1 Tax=Pseudoalteromonas carrageenovora TaxID=227 RepID=UPI0026E171B9|nr:FlgO family outer membrane protein [Pseudoalteromonas carrageenovora]MDO6465123.1 FlgO family outer membrane protein [Pseudoalteromonas carrageenovora]
MHFKYLNSAIGLATLLTLAGCSIIQNNESVDVVTPVDNTPNYDLASMLQSVQAEQNSEPQDSSEFVPLKHHKTLVNYVEQMALDLVDTLESEAQDNNSINIAVTTIVDLDASLNKSNQLGNQIAESFIHQLQKFGYGVVDFKAMNSIDVSNRGDFVLSRDIEKLSESSMANYVLAGTLIYRPNGVAVNTRVINVHSKHVVATSRKLIPLYVLNKEDIYLSSN